MAEESTIAIYYVEDNEVIRFGLRATLKRIAGFELVGETAHGETAVEEIVEKRPDVALVDIGLPDIDGIEVTKRVKRAAPDVRVVMLTASDDRGDIFDALDAGADGYVLKTDYARNLEIAIRSVRVGAVWLDPAIARIVLNAAQRPESSRPERKVEPILLSDNERTLLAQVAKANCEDGVCLVDPDFVQKLKRFSSHGRQLQDEETSTQSGQR